MSIVHWRRESDISSSSIEELRSQISGRLVLPDDGDYDEVRPIWNAMIDKRPAVFVQCAGAGDVATSIRFARNDGLEIAVRGAGHNIAGNALCDGGLVIDLSKLTNVRVDKQLLQLVN